MEQKTKIEAVEGRQEIFIRRIFDLPLEDLFLAYTEAEFLEQWMGTKVVTLENKKGGSYRFETKDPRGNLHVFSGVIHEFVPGDKITRTFEMEDAGFPVQLEYLEFKSETEETSSLVMQVVYRSVEVRDRILSLPFAAGINMAHNRLEALKRT